jgi:putative addiction module killer protein
MVTQVRPSTTAKIVEYVDLTGRRPFSVWLHRLDAVAAAKVTTALARLSQGKWAQVKPIGAGVHELRVDFGPGYRSTSEPMVRTS